MLNKKEISNLIIKRSLNYAKYEDILYKKLINLGKNEDDILNQLLIYFKEDIINLINKKLTILYYKNFNYKAVKSKLSLKGNKKFYLNSNDFNLLKETVSNFTVAKYLELKRASILNEGSYNYTANDITILIGKRSKLFIIKGKDGFKVMYLNNLIKRLKFKDLSIGEMLVILKEIAGFKKGDDDLLKSM